jgi:predicted TIM-barrel fold metal-dependent hydrolase
MGYRLENVRPIPYLDDMAADFPALQIIHAHPGWPYHQETLAVAWHKSNVWIDLSGFAPKYFPAEVVHYANSLLQDQVLFGTDWPVVGIDRWMREFDELPIKPEVRSKILLGNARRLLGI